MLIIAASILFTNLIYAAGPSIWVVDQGGNGNYTTIAGALANAGLVNGDTIKVIKGTYSETNLQVNKLVAMVAQDSVFLVSSGTTAIVFNSGAYGSLFYNFTVSGGDIYVYGIASSGTAKRTIIARNMILERTIQINGAAVVMNNTVRHSTTANPVGGIVMANHGSAATRTMIYGNSLRGCNLQVNYGFADVIANKIVSYPASFTNDAGLFISNSSNPHDLRIIGNTVDSSTTGLYSFGGTNVMVANNVFMNGANGMYTSNATTIYTNNVVYNASTKGITSSSGYFYGNIVANSAGSIPAGSAIWDYNCFFSSGAAPSGNGNIIADPLFTSAATGNFVLQGGSPCINTGSTVAIYRDIDKTRMDMGIYGGPTSAANYQGGTNPKVLDILITPYTVIQGNTITINASGAIE